MNWNSDDLRPILMDLGAYAYRAHADTRGAADARARVVKWVDQLLAREGNGKCARPTAFLPNAYSPLIPYGVSGMAGILLTLERVARAAGCNNAPFVWPSATEMQEAAALLGFGPHRVVQARADYRKALVQFRRADPVAAACFAEMPRLPHNNARHVGVALGIPGVGRQALQVAAPELYADVQDYVSSASGRGSSASDAWKELAWRATASIAGGLARAGLGEALKTMTFLDLWKPTVVAPISHSEPSARVKRHLQLGEGTTVLLSPLRVALDADIAESNRQSPASVSGGYNQGTMHQAQIAWAVVEGVYGEGLRASNPTEWTVVQAGWDTVRRHIGSNMGTAKHPKNKELAIETISYPQIIAVGLPILRRYVLSLLAQADATEVSAKAKGHEVNRHPEARAQRRIAHAWLERYVILAVFMDDGLRLKQYLRGCWGKNFIPTWIRDDRGVITGIARVQTKWSGAKDDRASLKIRFVSRKTKKLSERTRTLRGGVVDLDLLWRYLHDVRHPIVREAHPDLFPTSRTRTRGAANVAGTSEYDPEVDAKAGLPLFFSKRGRGPFTAPMVSRDRFGRALHWIAVHAFGRDVPEWGKGGKEWRALWSAHISRLHIASYWMLVRDNDKGVLTATHLTMDKEATLRKYYAEYSRLYIDAPSNGSTEDPSVYNLWIDRLIRQNEVFDTLDDRSLPLPQAARDYLASLGQADRRTPVRRARPGQAPPSPRLYQSATA